MREVKARYAPSRSAQHAVGQRPPLPLYRNNTLTQQLPHHPALGIA